MIRSCSSSSLCWLQTLCLLPSLKTQVTSTYTFLIHPLSCHILAAFCHYYFYEYLFFLFGVGKRITTDTKRKLKFFYLWWVLSSGVNSPYRVDFGSNVLSMFKIWSCINFYINSVKSDSVIRSNKYYIIGEFVLNPSKCENQTLLTRVWD